MSVFDRFRLDGKTALVSGHGMGRTHIATTIGVQAIEHHHKRVRFFSAVKPVNAFEQEKAQG
jgi:DNA replication protein DnaC